MATPVIGSVLLHGKPGAHALTVPHKPICQCISMLCLFMQSHDDLGLMCANLRPRPSTGEVQCNKYVAGTASATTLTSIMWSRKGILVLDEQTPVPSRSIVTDSFVSFVARLTVATRAARKSTSGPLKLSSQQAYSVLEVRANQ